MENHVNVILDGDEAEVLDVGVFEVEPVLGEDVWLLGKVLTTSKVVSGAFRAVMLSLWQSRNCEEVRQVGTNLFSFRFKKTKDRDLVLKSGPWFFNRHMLALNAYDVNVNPVEIPMTKVPFWVQIHGLPYTYRTEKVARSLAGGFDGFLDWDKRRSGESLRIRVWVRIDLPLRKGKLVAASKGKQPYKAIFKYEKLYDFCYRCGRMDHKEKECKEAVIPANQKKFGEWLRATTPAAAANRDGEGYKGGGRREEQGQWERNEGRRGPPRHGVHHPGGGSREQGSREHGRKGKEVATASMHEEENSKDDEDLLYEESGDNSYTAALENFGKGEEELFNSGTGGKNNSTSVFNVGGEVQRDSSENNTRKRSNVSSSAFGGTSTGFTPPLKRLNSECGLGLAGAVEQPRPPQ